MVRRRIQCPRCRKTKFWRTGDKRRKCKNCRALFTAYKHPYKIPDRILKEVVAEFVLEHSTNVMRGRVAISKYKLLKTLTLLRTAMTKDVPKVFHGIVEVDETYLGGQWKNKRLAIKRNQTKSRKGRGTTKQPAFGILCRNGQVWAELVEDVEADDLQPRIEQRVAKGTTVCSDTWRGYTGIAAKGYVHRLVAHGKGEYSDRKGNHINGLEGFWGYLKRKLVPAKIIHRQLKNPSSRQAGHKYRHKREPSPSSRLI